MENAEIFYRKKFNNKRRENYDNRNYDNRNYYNRNYEHQYRNNYEYRRNSFQRDNYFNRTSYNGPTTRIYHNRPYLLPTPSNFYGPGASQISSRSPSPIEGTDEYLNRKIQQTSAQIMRQLLNADEPSSVNHSNNLQKQIGIDKNDLSVNNCIEISDDVRDAKKKSSKNNINKKSAKEIYEKIISHISNLKDGRKINFINNSNNRSGYNDAIDFLHKQKRLEISRILRDMNKEPKSNEDCESSIVPDIGIKIEELPLDVIEELKLTLNLDLENLKEEITDDFVNSPVKYSNSLEQNQSSKTEECELKRIKLDTHWRTTADCEMGPNLTKTEITPTFEKNTTSDLVTLSRNFKSADSIEKPIIEYMPDDNVYLNNTFIENLNQDNVNISISSDGCDTEDFSKSIDIKVHNIWNESIQIKEEIFDPIHNNVRSDLTHQCESHKTRAEQESQIVLNYDINHVDAEANNNSRNIARIIDTPTEFPSLTRCELNESIRMEQETVVLSNNYQNHSANTSLLRNDQEIIDTSTADEPNFTLGDLNESRMEQDTMILHNNDIFHTPNAGQNFSQRELNETILEQETIIVNNKNDDDDDDNKVGHLNDEASNLKNDDNLEKLEIEIKQAMAQLFPSEDRDNFEKNRIKILMDKTRLVDFCMQSLMNYRRNVTELIYSQFQTNPIESRKPDNASSTLLNLFEETVKPNNKRKRVDSTSTELAPNLINQSASKFIEFEKVTDKITYMEQVENELILSTTTGHIIFLSLLDGKIKKKLKVCKEAITSVAFFKGINNLKYMYIGPLENTLQIYNFKEKCLISSLKIKQPILCMDVKWGYLFIGCKNGYILRYSCDKQKLEFEDCGSSADIFVLKTAREGGRKVLIVGSRSPTIFIKDAISGLCLRNFSDLEISSSICTLLVKENLLYCGTARHDLLVYSFYDGKIIQRIVPDMEKRISCLKICANLLFAGCYNGFIYIYNLKDLKLLKYLNCKEQAINCIEILNKQVVYSTLKGTFNSIELPEDLFKPN